MKTARKHKKNLIVSYKNLTDDIKELFKDAYPDGYVDHVQHFVKPNGETIFVVPFETEDTAYMVKFDLKIDTLGEDLDKALFDEDGDEGGKEEEFAPLSEAMEKEDDTSSHREKHLRHGDFEDLLSDEKKKKASLGVDKEGLKQALDDGEEDDEFDSYDKIDEDEDENDDDFEPSDDELRGIEDEFLDAEIPPLDATIPEDEVPEKPARKPAAKQAKAAAAKPAAKPASKPAAKPTAKTVAKPAAAKKAAASAPKKTKK